MKFIRMFRLLLAGFLLAGASCSQYRFDNIEGTKKGDILFRDDFSKVDGRWTTRFEDDGSLVGYQSSGLRFLINKPQYDYWSRPGQSFIDTMLEVETIKLDGPDDNHFGLICRFIDDRNFYAFLATSDGYYGILKVKDGQYHLLSGEGMKYSEYIHRGRSVNHLIAICASEELVLIVNDQRLISVLDQDFSQGDVGLIAGSFATPGVDIFFDNFMVYMP